MIDEKTAPTWNTATYRAGRNDLPSILVETYDDLPTHERPQAVMEAWVMPEWPEQHMPADLWVRFFDVDLQGTTHYIVDGEVVERATDGDLAALTDETGCITLYRGAIPARRAGLSWTADLDRAIGFANRFNPSSGKGPGTVWTMTIPIDFVLAHFTGRGEDEYVVDTTGFEDVEYTEVQR